MQLFIETPIHCQFNLKYYIWIETNITDCEFSKVLD